MSDNPQVEGQLNILRSLSEKVHNVYLGLRTHETDYLLVLERLRDAKDMLAEDVDAVYLDDRVTGKNERERDACLKALLPERYAKVRELDKEARNAERLYRVHLRDAERIALQVEIARMALLMEANDIPLSVDVANPQRWHSLGPNDNPHKPAS